MPLNGALAILLLRERHPALTVTETHPKVLYFALTQRTWDFESDQRTMNEWLSQCIGSTCSPRTEHEWDAIISAYAAREWFTKRWAVDLHAELPQADEVLVAFHGPTHYAWPESPRPMVRGDQTTTGRSRAEPMAGSRARGRWKAVADQLRDAGHHDVAQQVEDYRNARGERSGWDSWFRSEHPDLHASLD